MAARADGGVTSSPGAMRFGTFFFLQAPPWLDHPEVVRREIEQMAWTEELGFDRIWLTEHHFITIAIVGGGDLGAPARDDRPMTQVW